jgi:integrase
MARVKDLWHNAKVMGADGKPTKTAKHPATGGNKDANRWLGIYIGPDSKEKTKSFGTKVAAYNWARKQEEDLARGEYIDPNAGKTLFGDYGTRWLTSRGGVDPSSVILYESKYRLHIEPQFGSRKVGSIRPSEIQQFLTRLSDKYVASTVGTILLVLQGIFDLAVADEVVKKNPAKSDVVKVAEPPREKVVAWADQIVFAIIDAHPEHLQAMPVLGAGCGMRAAEWFGLAEEDLDFDEQVIHVRRQVKRLGKDFVFALPKSDKERTVPMPDWVAQYLKTHVQRHKPRPYTLPWEKPTGAPRTVSLLFRWSTDDKHIRHRNYDEAMWKPAAVKAGILPEPEQVKGADGKTRQRYATSHREGTHQLRHYYASVTLADGVSIKELSEYLGHSDPAFTLRVYAHMLTTSHDRARAAIDKRMLRPRLIIAKQN